MIGEPFGADLVNDVRARDGEPAGAVPIYEVEFQAWDAASGQHREFEKLTPADLPDGATPGQVQHRHHGDTIVPPGFA